MADYGAISDTEKARIASEFLMYAPPGEFNDVFNDVRILVNNDNLLRDSCSETFAQYNKEQMHPAVLDGQEDKCLITEHNNLESNVFHDPNSQKSFKFDHLKKCATDIKDCSADNPAMRQALDDVVRAMVAKQYPGNGSCAVFYKKDENAFVVAIENHKFQPANFWNGKWRSEYTVTIQGSEVNVKGVIKVQIHYYEDGNVQLISKKDVEFSVSTGSSDSETAKNVVTKILNAENEYHKAVTENYLTMSDTTFKALRRQLPITKSLISWEKILGYKIGNELKDKA